MTTVSSSGAKSNALERDRVRFVYDSDFNLIQMRVFHPSAKLGDKVVKLTNFVYDSDFNLIKIIPNFDSDFVVSDDLGNS